MNSQCATDSPGQPMTAAPLRLAFSVKETAEILGVSEKTVRRLISRGLLRSSRALRHLLIPKKEIERFLDDTSAN
jgi:excisionase family DNA binding protein